MFIDASALIAILGRELDAAQLADKLKTAPHRTISPLAVWEATVALARLRNADPLGTQQAVEAYLSLMKIEVVDIPAAVRFAAVAAFACYGKGRHPAALNSGDCFAYACAKAAGVPLLCKGDDFAQIDILRA